MTSILVKFKVAIDVAKNFEQLEHIENKLKVTSQINRRTKEGRETTKTIERYMSFKRQLLINNGEQPF